MFGYDPVWIVKNRLAEVYRLWQLSVDCHGNEILLKWWFINDYQLVNVFICQKKFKLFLLGFFQKVSDCFNMRG